MKYVIEINDHAINDSCTPALYRAKGFRALVFDQNGLNKLTPFETERMNAWNEGYDAGKKKDTQEVKQEYFDKGYRVGKHDADKSEYDRGYENGYAQCEEDMKCGYDEGYDEGVEAGKNAMREIVMNNLCERY